MLAGGVPWEDLSLFGKILGVILIVALLGAIGLGLHSVGQDENTMIRLGEESGATFVEYSATQAIGIYKVGTTYSAVSFNGSGRLFSGDVAAVMQRLTREGVPIGQVEYIDPRKNSISAGRNYAAIVVRPP